MTQPRRRRRRLGRLAALTAAAATAATAVADAGAASHPAAAPMLVGSCAGPHAGAENCLSPQTIDRAYGIAPLLARGVDGRGETVVVPSLPGAERGSSFYSTFAADLAAYDSRYGLPAVDLHVSATLGASMRLGAGPEAILDAETVHAVAPDARIEILLFPPAALLDDRLGAIVGAAAGRGDIVSISYGDCQSRVGTAALRSLDGALRTARDRHVSVIAAAGDSGAASSCEADARNVGLPSSAPLVTGVGGTQLTLGPDGRYRGETVWNTSSRRVPLATGGGLSARYPRPGYQDGLPGLGGHRGVPDVAADASPNSGFATVVVEGGRVVVEAEQGTSEAAPMWAGIAALADQDAGHALGFLNDGLYRIGRGALYHRAFHDVTRGNNSVMVPSGRRVAGFAARPGWDAVTGWGSPNAAVLVPLLSREVRPGDGRGL